ncbi:hypothetical protein [uncultured Cardiobacterium sp.]|nr:hypothetical protein [uncultured Cardiobacterium sp.]
MQQADSPAVCCRSTGGVPANGHKKAASKTRHLNKEIEGETGGP